MSADVIPIRPKATETFVCPCGSQWFTVARRYSVEGKEIERANEAHCQDCDRKHHLRPRTKTTGNS